MKLNESQLKAVHSTAPRILCVSGAGSGKTRVYVNRIMRMIRGGIDPRSIIAVTFTNAAAKEIQTRLGESIHLGFVGTLHGLCLRLLQQHGHLIGLAAKLTVLDDEETEALLTKVMADLSYKGTRKAVDAAVAKGLAFYRSGHWMASEHYDAERVAWEFYYRMVTGGNVTFDCILSLGLELLLNMATTTLGQYEHLRRFEHVLVDEYQDANALDAAIYDALPVKTRFFVGDIRQSIYKFRGSDIRVIQAENNRPGTTVLELAENYRSSQSVVDAANSLMADHPPMIAAKTELDGAVIIRSFDTAAEEAAAVAADIKAELASALPPSPAYPWGAKSALPNEIAVILRTNRLVNEYRTVLEAHGIPVRKRPPQDNPLDWKIARAFIAMLTNPENDRLAHKFLTLKLGAEKADAMEREATADFNTINQQFLHIRSVALADVTTAMAAASLGRESIARVRGLIETMPADSTLLELQAAIATMEAEAQEETEGVTVRTAHSAKGLQWECVWLPAFEEGIIPSQRELDEDGGAEAKRLAYVAITRAKRLLVISHAGQRPFEWKGVQKQQPSRFIEMTTKGTI